VLAADWIVVMEQGQVVDRGTHAALIERCGTYRAIAASQLAPATAIERCGTYRAIAASQLAPATA
jgi:ABC-type transport system involved in cytochrome bd biosynthesis fused ATPase/permease subunit